MKTAMIFAAGRGERMRPLTDRTPKPLLEVDGKPLIVRQIEALQRAGIQRIVINHAWLGEQFEAVLGNGSRWGVTLHYSAEQGQALETAGGIAKALPLLLAGPPDDDADFNADTGAKAGAGADTPIDPSPALARPHRVFLAVSGDIYSDFDYATLKNRAMAMHRLVQPAMHLIMVPNPPYHPQGDFAFDGERLALDGPNRLTFASFGLYDTRTFAALARRSPAPRMALLPFYREAIASGRASAEVWHGRWANVGTPEELASLTALHQSADQATDRPVS